MLTAFGTQWLQTPKLEVACGLSRLIATGKFVQSLCKNSLNLCKKEKDKNEGSKKGLYNEIPCKRGILALGKD